MRSVSAAKKNEKNSNKIYIRNKSKNNYETTKNNIFPNQRNIPNNRKKSKSKTKSKVSHIKNLPKKNNIYNNYSNFNTEPSIASCENIFNNFNEIGINNDIYKNSNLKNHYNNNDYYDKNNNMNHRGRENHFEKALDVRNSRFNSRSNSAGYARKPSSEWRKGDGSLEHQKVHNNYGNFNIHKNQGILITKYSLLNIYYFISDNFFILYFL